ncbi:MAG TPA: phospholipase D-like domain-containing protein [Vicinamibacterales bacterium]|nr:phospholipase D-like domain-containing protein [Vicinamibacterales bacterium]
MLERRHRLERLSGLRYHHKLVISVLVVLGIVAGLLAIAQDQETLEIRSHYAASDPSFPAYLTALLNVESIGGNHYQVLTNGEQFFPAMLQAIDGAQRRVSFETYIFEKGTVADQFSDALERAARRGVQVDLVVDAFGSDKMSGETIRRLRAAGATVGTFGKLRWYNIQQVNNRTHRKILVIDGNVAFTGGVGVGDHWLGHAQDPQHWRDTMVRIDGPLARLMEGVFDENLVETIQPATPIVDPLVGPPPATAHDTAFVIGSSPTGGANQLKRMYLLAIASARKTLDICTPYFMIDESSSWALSQAAARGVRIRILVEGDHTDAKPVKYASRWFYDGLMNEGIEIYEYQPTMMHTKVMVVDGILSMFGSANFDNRSLELNDEMNAAVTDPSLASRLDADFDNDLHRARKLDLASWRRRGVLEKSRDYFWSYFGEVF